MSAERSMTPAQAEKYVQLCDKLDRRDWRLLHDGEARLVLSSKRNRKLYKRGENIWWSDLFQGWLWTPARKITEEVPNEY